MQHKETRRHRPSTRILSSKLHNPPDLGQIAVTMLPDPGPQSLGNPSNQNKIFSTQEATGKKNTKFRPYCHVLPESKPHAYCENSQILLSPLNLSAGLNRQIPCPFQERICSSKPANERGRRLVLGKLPPRNNIVRKGCFNSCLVNLTFAPLRVTPFKARRFLPSKHHRYQGPPIRIEST